MARSSPRQSTTSGILRTFSPGMSTTTKPLSAHPMPSKERKSHKKLQSTTSLSRPPRTTKYTQSPTRSSPSRRSLTIMAIRKTATKLKSMIISNSPSIKSILNSPRLLGKTLLKHSNRDGLTRLAPSLNQKFK